MQNSFDTSFIPQQPLLRVEGVERSREPLNFALVLSFIVFFVSLITAGGIYLYQRQIDARIVEKSAQLAALEKTLNSDEINVYKRVDLRISTARALLRDHGVFSLVLDFLENETAKDIGLTSLSYTTNKDNNVEVHIRGVGPSFQSVYFQSETWKAASPFVIEMDIDSVNLSDTTGVVDFDATIVIDPAYLKYKKLLETEAAMAAPEESTASTTTP